QHLNPNQAATLTIAGGGAGAVEIALAARQVMPCRGLAAQRQIIIYAGRLKSSSQPLPSAPTQTFNTSLYS
ncbi:MAG: hypothetical protein HOH40_00625, partial [Oceanospirillaceae bacterium]|nr:hypothetical protein [Oceanospirillaceae bacterium]